MLSSHSQQSARHQLTVYCQLLPTLKFDFLTLCSSCRKYFPSCRGVDMWVQSYFQVRGDEHKRSITVQNFSLFDCFHQLTEVSAARETEQLIGQWPCHLCSHFWKQQHLTDTNGFILSQCGKIISLLCTTLFFSYLRWWNCVNWHSRSQTAASVWSAPAPSSRRPSRVWRRTTTPASSRRLATWRRGGSPSCVRVSHWFVLLFLCEWISQKQDSGWTLAGNHLGWVGAVNSWWWFFKRGQTHDRQTTTEMWLFVISFSKPRLSLLPSLPPSFPPICSLCDSRFSACDASRSRTSMFSSPCVLITQTWWHTDE